MICFVNIFNSQQYENILGWGAIYFVNLDASIINDLCWMHHIFIFPCKFSMINAWTLNGSSQKNSIKLAHVSSFGTLWGV